MQSRLRRSNVVRGGARWIFGASLLAGMVVAGADAQQRAHSERSIPVTKSAASSPPAGPPTSSPPTANAPPLRIVPGTNTDVYETPVVTRFLRSESGSHSEFFARATTPSAPSVLRWLPLAGVVGGAVLVSQLGTASPGVADVAETPLGAPPAAVAPPITAAPEPATTALLATGLAAIALSLRRRWQS